MKLEMLVRLLAAASPAQLDELALWYFRSRGYAPVVRDGTADSGVDLRLFEIGGTQRVAVQATTQRKGLFAKLLTDATHAKTLGVEQLWVVSSHRLPEAGFTDWSDKILVRTGVNLTRADAQTLVSHAFNRHALADVLRILDIEVTEPTRQPPRRADLRTDLACSHAFFGVDPEHFRRSILDRALTGVVCAEGGPMNVALALSQTAQLLALAPGQKPLLASALDRLRQQGALTGNGTIDASPAARADWQALQTSGEETRSHLVAAFTAAFARHLGPRDVPPMVDLALQAVAAFVISPAEAIAPTHPMPSPHAHDVHLSSARTASQLRILRRHLELAGVTAEPLDALLREIAEIAQQSVWARTLAAGELYLHLATLTRETLARALTGGSDLEVIIDPSVAMPMLCVREHGNVRHKFFETAAQVLAQVELWQSDVKLPAVYLEEMAAHLIDAWDNYAALVAEESELRGSTNSFVSHFAALRAEGSLHGSINFDAYVASFGLVPALRSGDYRARRSAVMQRLRTAMSRLGITTVDAHASPDARRLVEQNLAYLFNAPHPSRREPDRPRILVDHDAEVLAWLDGLPLAPTRARIVCSWDRIIFRYHHAYEPTWDAFDPLTLGDTLALMHPDPEAPLASIGAIASELAGEDVELAARIWDALAEIEKGALADAVLRKQARAFKDDYLHRRGRLSSVRSIQAAWAAWKANTDEPG